MLQLLWLLSSVERVSTTREMARTLGIGEDLLKKMIEDAVRFGYLAPAQAARAIGPCSDCGQRGGCLEATASLVWSLTPRGRRLLNQSPAPPEAD